MTTTQIVENKKLILFKDKHGYFPVGSQTAKIRSILYIATDIKCMVQHVAVVMEIRTQLESE